MFCVVFRYIQLPGANELHQLAQALPDGRQVVMYIDGFIVRIQRPDNAGDSYFCGRHGKSCDSINVQYVVDRWGRIRHIITGLPGSTHDKTAALWSNELQQFLNNLPDGYVVLGDAAYRGLHQRVTTPITARGPLTPAEQQFNDACVRLCQIVERSIGAGELKWRIQQLKDNRIAAKKVFCLRQSAPWLQRCYTIGSQTFCDSTSGHVVFRWWLLGTSVCHKVVFIPVVWRRKIRLSCAHCTVIWLYTVNPWTKVYSKYLQKNYIIWHQQHSQEITNVTVK